MIKFIILFLVCIKISTGYNEEYSDYTTFPNIDNAERPSLPIPINNRNSQVQLRKPCPLRRFNNPDEESRLTSFQATATKPLTNFGLESQSLKNENINDNYEASERLSTELSLINNNSSNHIDSTDVNNGGELINIVEKIYEYDCSIELNTDVPVTSEPLSKSAEKKVVEMLKECLNKKEKHLENKLQEKPIAGTRRSGSADTGDANVDSEFTGSDDNELNTERSTYNTDAIVPDDSNSNVPTGGSIDRSSLITLGTGKLYNELQDAAKAAGISKYPVSRRMQDSSRVCFACSSATSLSCLTPDKRTTIKYCREDQNCITKSFGEKDTLTVIRDCAKSCESSGIPGIQPKYNKCNICHKDLCNGAANIGYNMLIIFMIITLQMRFLK